MRKIQWFMLCFIVALNLASCSKITNQDVRVGNSASNHANGGLFCMTGDKIVYSQLNNRGEVHMAEPDGNGRELLLEEGAYNLNCIGDNVYYQKMSDSTVWRYDISKKQSECVIAEGVKDVVVTNQGLLYLYDNVCWRHYKGETSELFDARYAQYLDYNYPVIYYAEVNNDGLLSLYQWECTEQEKVLMENIRGSVVIGDVLYCTGEENNLISYNITEKTSEDIRDGYNVQKWNDRLFFLDREKIYTCIQNEEIHEISEVYDLHYQEYEFHSYYICSDYMYLIFHDETLGKYIYKGINLQTGEVFEL